MTRTSSVIGCLTFALVVALVGCMQPRGAAKTAVSSAPAAALAADPLRAVVLVHVDGVDVDWNAPWSAGRAWSYTFLGLPVEGHRVLVGAWGMRNARHVEVQKPGAVARATAQVTFYDPDVGLGLLSVEDGAFWADLPPVSLPNTLPALGRVKVVHALPEGLRAEAYDGVATGYDAKGTFPFHQLKIEQVDPQHVGISDAVSVDGRFVGVVTNSSAGEVLALASPTLADFVDLASHLPYRGYAASGFTWQRLSNPVLRDTLGLGEGEGGVMVRRVWPLGSANGVLEQGDVVLTVAGTKIDSDGTYVHPIAGRPQMQTLFSNGTHPGDSIPVQISRHGERKTVNVVLKSWPASRTLVPPFGDRNGYVVRGGLVFERLSREYLLTFGKDWEEKAPPALLEPFELERFAATTERPGVVVVTRALPVPATLGYEHVGNVVVDRINGAAVRTLDEVREAFTHPSGGFHVVTFTAGQGVRRIVLDAEEAKRADESLRDKYHFDEAGPAPAAP